MANTRVGGQAGAPWGKSQLAQKVFEGRSPYSWGPLSFCLLRPQLMHEVHIIDGNLWNSKSFDFNVTCT